MKYYFILLIILFSPLQTSLFSQDAKNKTVTEDSLYPDLELTITENRLIVKNAPVGKILDIYFVTGAKAKRIEIKNSNGEYLLNLPKGLYYIKLNGMTIKTFKILT